MPDSSAGRHIEFFRQHLSGRKDARRQITRRIARLAKSGALPAGTRLPPSRQLAAQLGVARGTVEAAYAELEAAGLLERRVGAGTFVAAAARGGQFQPFTPDSPEPYLPAFGVPLSARGAELLAQAKSWDPVVPRPFEGAMADYQVFPLAEWNRLLRKQLSRPPEEMLSFGHPAGLPALRLEIARYLRRSRGVECAPEQVVVLSSSQQALDLFARLLLNPGEVVACETPGYLGAVTALQSAGCRLLPIPVDDHGLEVAALAGAADDWRAVYVTPSNQYPTGVSLTEPRRLELLAMARGRGAWIFEDDYDSEFRYDGLPLPAMQSLDPAGRVVYCGTFSKLLFPGLRIAYVVAPAPLAGAFATARYNLDGHSPLLTQWALADFLAEGALDAHIRQVRSLYTARWHALREALAGIPGLLPVRSAGGLRMTVRLAPTGDPKHELAVQAAARERGLALVPLSRCDIGRRGEQGFILGFSALSPEQIRQGCALLAAAIAAVAAT